MDNQSLSATQDSHAGTTLGDFSMFDRRDDSCDRPARPWWVAAISAWEGVTGMQTLAAVTAMQVQAYLNYQGTVSHWAFDPWALLTLAVVIPKFYWAIGLWRGWKHAYDTLRVVTAIILILWGISIVIPLFAPWIYRFSPVEWIEFAFSVLGNCLILKGLSVPAAQGWFAVSLSEEGMTRDHCNRVRAE